MPKTKNGLYKVQTKVVVEPVVEGCYKTKLVDWRESQRSTLSDGVFLSFCILGGKYEGRLVEACYDDELMIQEDGGKCSDFYWVVSELFGRRLKDGELVDLDSLVGLECTIRVWRGEKARVVTAVDRERIQ